MTGLDASVLVRRTGFTLDARVRARPGSVTAILGPNGSGKTTLLDALAGLTAIDAGLIRLDAVVLDDPADGTYVEAERRRVGMVFQDLLLFPHLSVIDNVAFGPRSHGVAGPRELARNWLRRLGCEELADRRPSSLSGGQAQRIAMARALAAEPDLLLLDEPLAALDASTRIEVRRELRTHLSLFGGITLIVTHDPLDAMVLADEILILEHGLVTQQGTTQEVARRPATPYIAALMGANLMHGDALDGHVTLPDGASIAISDPALRGDTIVVIRPEAIVLHVNRPEGSARNVWPVTVTDLEPRIDRMLVHLAGPPDLTAAVTPAAVTELGVAPGSRLWASVKALDLDAYARSATPGPGAGR